MDKLDKVIRALNCCLSDAECDFGCPYWAEGEAGEDSACELMKKDALALLKELDGKYRAAIEMAAIATEKNATAVEVEPVVHAHWVSLPPDQRDFWNSHLSHSCSHCGTHGCKHYKRCQDCGAIMDEKVFEPTPLGMLCLGGRVTKRLKQMGVTTVEQLEAMDKHTLYNIDGLGKKSILEIESELRIWKNEKENTDG